MWQLHGCPVEMQGQEVPPMQSVFGAAPSYSMPGLCQGLWRQLTEEEKGRGGIRHKSLSGLKTRCAKRNEAEVTPAATYKETENRDRGQPRHHHSQTQAFIHGTARRRR